MTLQWESRFIFFVADIPACGGYTRHSSTLLLLLASLFPLSPFPWWWCDISWSGLSLTFCVRLYVRPPSLVSLGKYVRPASLTFCLRLYVKPLYLTFVRVVRKTPFPYFLSVVYVRPPSLTSLEVHVRPPPLISLGGACETPFPYFLFKVVCVTRSSSYPEFLCENPFPYFFSGLCVRSIYFFSVFLCVGESQGELSRWSFGKVNFYSFS